MIQHSNLQLQSGQQENIQVEKRRPKKRQNDK